MRTLVIDASAAIKLVLEEPGRERVSALISERSPKVTVPWLFWLEIVNGLARGHRWAATSRWRSRRMLISSRPTGGSRWRPGIGRSSSRVTLTCPVTTACRDRRQRTRLETRRGRSGRVRLPLQDLRRRARLAGGRL